MQDMMPPAVADAIDGVNAALARRQEIDAALDRAMADRPALEAALAEAETALGRADAKALLKPGEASVAEAEAAVRNRDNAGMAIDRLNRAIAALQDQAHQADEEIAIAKAALASAAQAFESETTDRLDAELREAARPLVGVLLRMHAFRQATGFRGFVQILQDINVPAMRPGHQSVVSKWGFASFHAAGGSNVRLSEWWPNDPAAAALADALLPLGEARRRLEAHRNYTPPSPPGEPYVRKGVTVSSPPRPAAPTPATPSPRFIPNSWSDRPTGALARNARTGSPGAELNPLYRAWDEEEVTADRT